MYYKELQDLYKYLQKNSLFLWILIDKRKYLINNESKGKKNFLIPGYIICSVVGIAAVFVLSMNVQFMSQNKEDYFLFRFRDEVLQKDDSTLLNIGCLDAGLYTLTGIVPSCRWFQTQTLDIPEKENNPYYEQDRYIREGLTDFVLARDTYPEHIFDNYDLIDQADYSYSEYDFTYYLFRKKN